MSGHMFGRAMLSQHGGAPTAMLAGLDVEQGGGFLQNLVFNPRVKGRGPSSPSALAHQQYLMAMAGGAAVTQPAPQFAIADAPGGSPHAPSPSWSRSSSPPNLNDVMPREHEGDMPMASAHAQVAVALFKPGGPRALQAPLASGTETDNTMLPETDAED